MSDGTYADYVPENPKVYNINLRYCLVTPMPQEEIQKQLNGSHMLQVDNEGKEELVSTLLRQAMYGGDAASDTTTRWFNLQQVTG